MNIVMFLREMAKQRIWLGEYEYRILSCPHP